jgi:hypothetical protein
MAESVIDEVSDLFSEGWCICRSSSLPDRVLKELELNRERIESLQAQLAEARAESERLKRGELSEPHPMSLLVSMQRERDVTLAVIEQVRAVVEHIDVENYESGSATVGELADLLDAAPSSALDAVKADAWDEGHALGSGPGRCECVNPYRRES